jgi:hypothetical protein
LQVPRWNTIQCDRLRPHCPGWQQSGPEITHALDDMHSNPSAQGKKGFESKNYTDGNINDKKLHHSSSKWHQKRRGSVICISAAYSFKDILFCHGNLSRYR